MRFPGFTKIVGLYISNLSHQVFLLSPRLALGEKEDVWEGAGSKAERQENINLGVLPLLAIPIPM